MIHFAVLQKPIQYCKAVFLHLKNKIRESIIIFKKINGLSNIKINCGGGVLEDFMKYLLCQSHVC